MISKQDVILLLTELEEQGTDVEDQLRQVVKATSVPLSIIKFINDRRQLDLAKFYEKLRKSYNSKKSKLYLSIVKEVEEPAEAVITLSSYGLQAALFAKQAEDSEMFLKHARAREVSLVLARYYTDYDLTGCLQLLRLIKADLVACETVAGRRE